MKTALVLAGGGTRGIYQVGVLKALKEMGKDRWDMVLGTSVGALNAVMVVQKDMDILFEMYNSLESDDIVNGVVPSDVNLNTLVNEPDTFINSFKYYVKEGSADVSPFIDFVGKYYNAERFFQSDIDFGCIVATYPKHEGVYITKEMMKDKGNDWLIASCSAYPAFPVKVIDEVEYVDGGFFDNLPIDYALQKGADEIVAIDLHEVPQHPGHFDRTHIHYILPKRKLPRFLDFNKTRMEHTERMGYLDAYKHYGIYDGHYYTFEKMDLPRFFDRWYLDIMLLESKIKLATNINERFRSNELVRSTLLQEMHKTHLEDRDYFFGMLDHLMDLCDMDDTQVYVYTEARNAILAQFAKAAQEDYAYYPTQINVKDILEYTKTLTAKGIVEKLVHANLYPNDPFLSENIILTVYPFEQALADLVTYMMKDLMEDDVQ